MDLQTAFAIEQTCTLRMRWVAVGIVQLDKSGKLQFPTAAAAPGLYRFRLQHGGGRRSSYIGETDNLPRRFAHYRNPGPSQQTNLRVNAMLREVLNGGGIAEIDLIVDTAWLTIAGEMQQANLKDRTTRRLFECMAQCTGGSSDVETLNR